MPTFIMMFAGALALCAALLAITIWREPNVRWAALIMLVVFAMIGGGGLYLEVSGLMEPPAYLVSQLKWPIPGAPPAR